jgi:hypothetical protein
LDLNWKRYINRDWSTVTGYRFTNEHDTRDRAFSGLQHRLPFLTYGEVTLDTEGDVRTGLSRELQLTSRLSWMNELEYDTRTEWEWNTGLKYRLNKRWSLTGGFHSDHSFGAGLNFQW